MPDIIITPSSGIIDFFPASTRVGRIDGSGNSLNITNPSGYVILSSSGLSVNSSSPNATLFAYSATSGATLLNIEGTNGSLFSVVDNLSGTLMSVNNNAGLPVFEVFSDDRVVAGRFGQNDFIMTSGGNVGIGTGVPSSKFHVVGTSTFNGDVSATGSFIGGSGTTALPSFEFINDPDTGLFSPAANTFSISTSGVERLRINSIGNIGIATTSPNSQLHVIGTGIISSRLGINTNSPSVALDVSGTVLATSGKFNTLKILYEGDYIDVSPLLHGHFSSDIITTSNSLDFGTIDSLVDAVSFNGYSYALENLFGGQNAGDCVSENNLGNVIRRDNTDGGFAAGTITCTGVVANSGSFKFLNINSSGVGLYDTSILSLGTISGTNSINCGQDKQIQTLTLNGTATTFTKGSGWPTSNSVSRDVTLNITCSGNTSVTWSVVNDWYRQPDSPLPSGKHNVLLRAIGSGTIEGHYIGNKTN